MAADAGSQVAGLAAVAQAVICSMICQSLERGHKGLHLHGWGLSNW